MRFMQSQILVAQILRAARIRLKLHSRALTSLSNWEERKKPSTHIYQSQTGEMNITADAQTSGCVDLLRMRRRGASSKRVLMLYAPTRNGLYQIDNLKIRAAPHRARFVCPKTMLREMS